MSASERERPLSVSAIQPDAKPATAPAAPAAAAKPAPASGQAEAAKPAAAGALPEPKAPAFNKARLDGKLSVVQSRDFHPDHNTFVEQKIREFAARMEYPLDHSWAEAYAGAGNVVAKLAASVQA